MNIFKRLLRIGQAEIHSAVDKMEDPIRMTEQGIREMREDLDKALEALAQIRAMAIRTKNDKAKKQTGAQDYENKAVLLLTKAQKGELELETAEKLAKEALALKESLLAEAATLAEQQVVHENSADEIQKNVEILKFNITKWENELKTLKSRIKVSRATKEVNKQMAQIDSNSTISMLERMKEKVEEEEALAQAYGDIAKKRTSVDEEIDKAIGEDAGKVNEELDEIKRKLGML
ncbi:phage shock protein A [Dysgonomonas sp. PFB1-18]|uniref:PspA/IM30 family protein n=1 Tax=unclassified Dysgonomonas TaxID=2630389 RepID=UPI0024748EC7|nr:MULTISPECIES: PspA/IM30 family protein [unclassified Dysgonomonas]MDH6309536.1 phage shock protein A [Dysgonomonas sp. PF1-14]MDH6339136.1 phage shock protein A [Dysgonomonas sp. PF1-16]MDH6380578.1 phage shock protein A [Dysgonomonas sp. PFB1-18]MDH6398074.1 phage shock protein A [Dysgonomonas sp. PF1-23]